MRQLTSLDTQFLAFEDRRNLGHVSGLAIIDPSTAPGGRFGLQQLCDLLSDRLHLLPPFTWRLAEVPLGLNHPYWVEDADFDLEYHVRELALPEPGDDRQLADQVARIHARALDRSRPLWETYVIQGLADGRVGILTKMHHSAVDGMSGAEILTTLLDLSPDGRDVPPPTDGRARPERLPSQVEMLARGLADRPAQQLRTLRAIPRTLAHLDAIPVVNLLPGTGTVASVSRRVAALTRRNRDGGVLEGVAYRAPRTVLNGPISQHRRFSFASLSLTDVKATKNHLGLTVNDVVMAMCTGALRSWLLERDELPDRPLVAQVPVSVRTPEQRGTFGNRVSVMSVPLPTNEPDPLRRAQRINEIMRAAKERHRAVPASILQDATQFIPPALFARASRVTLGLGARRGPVSWNVVISNVPGSPVPLYFGGAKLLANHPVSAITDGLGLNMTVLSYLDQLDFGIVADRDQVPDAWPMIAGLREALDELLALVPPQPRPTGAPKATPRSRPPTSGKAPARSPAAAASKAPGRSRPPGVSKAPRPAAPRTPE
jgi:diacylglycerol O-acyltransferase / wax synthase